MNIALKELEPFIRDGEHLQTGKPFKNFGGLRSREVLANWLLCVTINWANDSKLTFTSDPLGGDGIIYDSETGQTWPTEHVIVPKLRLGDAGVTEELVLKAIKKKCTKGGAAYAAGKTLVVFLNAGAQRWKPNRVARELPEPLQFASVWVVGLHRLEAGEYVYAVAHMDFAEDDVPTFLVRIGSDFDAWEVSRIQ